MSVFRTDLNEGIDSEFHILIYIKYIVSEISFYSVGAGYEKEH